jgi:transcriptional regulator with PAS, ATPase and Fis domain
MTSNATQHLTALWVTSPHEAAARVRKALKQTDGNQTHAAHLLGISDRTIRRWLADAERKRLIDGAAR